MLTQLYEASKGANDEFVLSLIDKYGRLVRNIVSARLGDTYPDSVEDAIQDTYEAFCRQADDIRRADHPSSYISTMALRYANREYHIRAEFDCPLPEDYLIADKPHEQGLEEILPASTSVKDRAILIRIFHEQLTAVEVADMVGSRPDAVRAEKKRALDRLRKRLNVQIKSSKSREV